MSKRETVEVTEKKPRVLHARGFDLASARKVLARRDRALGQWMKRIGEIETRWHQRFDPVDSLARSILYQQLSGKAAATIHGRVLDRYGVRKKLTPAGLFQAPEAGLRECGVSFNKIAALKDLAAKAELGVVPTLAMMKHLHHDDIVARLTEVRGIGRCARQAPWARKERSGHFAVPERSFLTPRPGATAATKEWKQGWYGATLA